MTLTGCICDNSGIVAALVNGGLVVGHIIGVRGLQDNVLIAVAVLIVPRQALDDKLFKIVFCDLVDDVVGFFANCQNRLCCVIDSFPITRLVSRIRFSIQGHRTDIGIDLALTLLVEGKLNSLSWFHFPNLVDGVGDLILDAVDNFACSICGDFLFGDKGNCVTGLVCQLKGTDWVAVFIYSFCQLYFLALIRNSCLDKTVLHLFAIGIVLAHRCGVSLAAVDRAEVT